MKNLIANCKERCEAIRQTGQPPIGIERDYLEDVSELLIVIENIAKQVGDYKKLSFEGR